MNILQITDAFTGLFPKKISVTLIHATTHTLIGTYKINSERLPEAFNKPTMLEINGQSWQVTGAKPFHSNDYIKGKRLLLHVQEPDSFQQHNIRSLVPTKAYLPEVTFTHYLPHDFACTIETEDWRQIELLPATSIPIVEEELLQIKAITSNMAEDSGLRGYDTVHTRTGIGWTFLNIPFYEFYQFVNGTEKGNIQFGHGGFIIDGFFIQSPNYLYYGKVQQHIITHLCLQTFNGVDDEVTDVLVKFDLTLVDWCCGTII